MAFLTIQNVELEGIASCVPKNKQLVEECPCLTKEDAERLSATTGILERRIALPGVCSSDLCFAAAEKLINELQWDKSSIDALVFVTQTPDYILPSTAPILQNRLGLSKSCFTLDISLGCSGYVYGLATLASLVSAGIIKRGLLLVGDTVSKVCSPADKSTYPLFGDAGTASALSYNKEAKPISALFYSDGSGAESISIKDGGFRNGINEHSLTSQIISNGIERNACQLILDGMDVFSFGITRAPEVVKELLGKLSLESAAVDYFVFHQANKLMNEKIRKKLGISPEQNPYSLGKFGNTSCATIPLTITTELASAVSAAKTKFVLCGFGVGLSWGAVYLETERLICPPLIEV